MSPAVSSSLGIVAYLALFVGVGVVFLFANLLVGRFVRAADPFEEKLEIYECGEPTIGSSFVQFDLRFYVVALLFIIFDVEVAFFFPWATVLGKSTHLMEPNFAVAVAKADGTAELTSHARLLYQEMGVRNPRPATEVPVSLSGIVSDTHAGAGSQVEQVAHAGARQLALLTIVDIVVFFAVLLVGFAYVWKRGDLDWVRALTQEPNERAPAGTKIAVAGETVLSA
jgi:NADH-quinone oxidoreductase subunit A